MRITWLIKTEDGGDNEELLFKIFDVKMIISEVSEIQVPLSQNFLILSTYGTTVSINPYERYIVLH